MTRPKWPTHQKKTLLVKRDWTSRRPPWRCTFESCIKMESRAGGTAGKKHRREAKQFENIKAPEPDNTVFFSDLTQRVQELQSMETRFHTQEVVENPNPHQNRKDNPPQELRCGRAHVGNIGDQGHHQGYPRPAGHGGEGALDPQRKLKQRQGKNPERRDNAAEL